MVQDNLRALSCRKYVWQRGYWIAEIFLHGKSLVTLENNLHWRKEAFRHHPNQGCIWKLRAWGNSRSGRTCFFDLNIEERGRGSPSKEKLYLKYVLLTTDLGLITYCNFRFSLTSPIAVLLPYKTISSLWLKLSYQTHCDTCPVFSRVASTYNKI